MFSKILIANRGEIAVRVMRTAQAMGYRTVAVYSEADAQAEHVKLADQAVCIGPAPVGESYLRSDHILEAARQTGADAIHPGYGFLSENAAFARACQAAGIIFVGPDPDAIELMGSKRLSKIAMQAAGVPTVPGYQGADQSDATLLREAGQIGFPLMVKASAGGGGRGMRLVQDPKHLAEEIQRARSEAKSAFGSDELILERAVIQPRHIEIQVFADRHGNAVYLGERDCSIQRRHQKVVEEAPSPFMTPELRAAMGDAAVKAALACQYVGAGTVEFLVDAERHFYFLEMNTRLQVEHPVTECITGEDLVEWQLRVAANQPLPKQQAEINLRGHAIEVRLYAEDPAHQFTPQTGQLLAWQPRLGAGIRFDTGVTTGSRVSPFYDPMLAKVIAFGRDREEARRRLLCALEDTLLLGVTTNRYFLTQILRHPVFIEGAATTAFLDQDFGADDSVKPLQASPLELALAANILCRSSATTNAWQNGLGSAIKVQLQLAEQPAQTLLVSIAGDDCKLSLQQSVLQQSVLQQSVLQQPVLQQPAENNAATVSITQLHLDAHALVYLYQGIRQRCQYYRAGDQLYLQSGGRNLQLTDTTQHPVSTRLAHASGRLQAPMDGAIVDLLVSEGDQVEAGQLLAVLEAMKMEHPLKAAVAGRVEAVATKKGDQVKRHQLLIQISSATSGMETSK